LWAAATLEDLRGSVDLLVFPQTLQQLQGVLKPDAALLIKGRVRHEESAPTKVVVSEARPLEAAADGKAPELLIRVDLSNASEDLLPELEGLLTAFPGDNPIVLELTRSGDFQVRLRPRRPAGVKAESELFTRLQDLCGADAVSLQKPAG
jgi:DNA polymerase-3 subunit alpha